MNLPPHRRARGGPADLGTLLAEVARRSGDQRLREASLAAALADVLGTHLCRRLAAVSMEGDVLRLEMGDAGAAREIERHASEIVRRLRLRLGRLAPVAVVAGHSVHPPRIVPRQVAARVHWRALPLATAALASVADEGERRALARWLRLAPEATGK